LLRTALAPSVRCRSALRPPPPPPRPLPYTTLFRSPLARARQAFADVEFNPGVLRDVSTVDTSREMLGGSSAMPFAIAPTGFTRLMQTEGEVAGAGAAQAAGIPFTLSTLGTTSIEDVAAAAPHGRKWFQLYVMRKREISYDLVERAARAGFDTLQFTVDTPVAGAR